MSNSAAVGSLFFLYFSIKYFLKSSGLAVALLNLSWDESTFFLSFSWSVDCSSSSDIIDESESVIMDSFKLSFEESSE